VSGISKEDTHTSAPSHKGQAGVEKKPLMVGGEGDGGEDAGLGESGHGGNGEQKVTKKPLSPSPQEEGNEGKETTGGVSTCGFLFVTRTGKKRKKVGTVTHAAATHPWGDKAGKQIKKRGRKETFVWQKRHIQ